MKWFGVGIALGVVGTVLIAVAAWLIVVYTGSYNVAASDPHADAVRWTLDTTMRRSVSSRAGGTELSEDPSEEMLAEGARHYAESCVYCHGAPGEEPTEWSRGMRPEPPHLTEAATEWTPQELHWIIANGIKMSGMPAFGEHHGPEELIALTTFVTALPGLSAEDYEQLSQSGSHGGTQASEGAEPPAEAPAAPVE